MARKILKAKEPVRIRFKKLANGNKSIYFDTYFEGVRKYEFIHLNLIPETTPAARLQNQNTMQAANAIKAQRILELTNGKAGVHSDSRSKILLSDWLDYCVKQKKTSAESTYQNYRLTAERVRDYAAAGLRLCDVDKAFCIGFAKFLQYEYMKSNGEPLSKMAAHEYLNLFNSMLNMAVRDGIIITNPIRQMDITDKISRPESERVYLTKEELCAMIQTECKNPIVKQAFLFSCFCGLRISDIERLRWNDVQSDGGQMRVILTMQKTQKPLYIPLSRTAAMYLPERGQSAAEGLIFGQLPTRGAIFHNVKDWAKSAGIKKNISFHTARHTFATMLLTEGADLYTVSKLLGHTKINTTQIYAKIVDKKKDEAVCLLDGLFD